jgi:hypothetical protein
VAHGSDGHCCQCRIALDADGVPVEVNEMTVDSSADVSRYEFDRS